jgi:hypothetical protein
MDSRLPTSKQPSHLMYGALGGLGTMLVPLGDAIWRFAQAVVDDYRVGVFWGITENKPAGFPMKAYFDLDWSFESDTQVRDAEEAFPVIVRIIVGEMKKFWPTAPPDAFEGLVLASGIRQGVDVDAAPAPAPASAPASAPAPSAAATAAAAAVAAAVPVAPATVAGAGSGFGGGSSDLELVSPAMEDVPSTAATAAGGDMDREEAAPPPSTSSRSRFRAGIHLVFNLRVDVEQALYLAAAVTASLDNSGLPCGSSTWDQVVDKAVYHESRGLRWAWQVKDRVCTACQRNSMVATKCDTCGGLRKVPDRKASMYTPRARITKDGDLVDAVPLAGVTCPTADLLVEASIRGADPAPVMTPGWVLYPGHPPLPVLVKKRVDGLIQAFADVSASKARVGADEQEVARADPRFSFIQACVRRLRREYADITINRAVFKMLGSRPSYRVLVSGFGSRFCGNKGSDHGSSTVWFQVSPQGVQQRCHCHKVFNEQSCKLFKGACVPLGSEAAAVLFPGFGQSGGASGGAQAPSALMLAAQSSAPLASVTSLTIGIQPGMTLEGAHYTAMIPKEIDCLIASSRHSKYEALMAARRARDREREAAAAATAATAAAAADPESQAARGFSDE